MIVPMKKARLIGLGGDRDKLLAELMRLGCVENSDQTELLVDSEYEGLIARAESDTADIKSATQELKQALDTLISYAHPKKSLFDPRPVLSEKELLNGQALQNARKVSAEIMELKREIAAMNTEEIRLQNRRSSLKPWENLDVPLSVGSTDNCVVQLGVCPAAVQVDELNKLLSESVGLYELFVVGSDREQHYLMFLCHNSVEFEASAMLKTHGFSRMQFKDVDTTAREAVAVCDNRIAEIGRNRKKAEEAICAYVGEQPMLERAIDALGLYMARAEAAERALSTQSCFYITAWVDETRLPKVEKIFNKFDCAYEFLDPDPDGERPPIKLKNSRLIEPFNMVTDMYSPPDYYNIDPNPLYAPFFALFFGIMYADLGYGLVLIALSLFVNKKMKPRGMMGQMFGLMSICGVTTAAMGIVFGGFFSDIITVVGKTFFGTDSWRMPALWFDPLSDPLKMLIFTLVLGGIQIIVGMIIKAYILIRDGKPWDALMDIGSWWLTFAGIAVLALGGGMWVMLAGFAAIILTQGRDAKGILGKLMGGLGKLYDITAYLSDVLSYSRLMALGMAGAVIGSVFNMLAGMVGAVHFIVGPILFVVIFLVGHVFNMGINIIGTYVHAARLQYLEYFGKFYEGGGKPFQPLTVQTKFVDIIKEEN